MFLQHKTFVKIFIFNFFLNSFLYCVYIYIYKSSKKQQSQYYYNEQLYKFLSHLYSQRHIYYLLQFVNHYYSNNIKIM
jgi:hypothetical protein